MNMSSVRVCSLWPCDALWQHRSGLPMDQVMALHHATASSGVDSLSDIISLDFLNTWKSRQNGRHFSDIFKCIFLNENVWISIKMSLEFVPRDQIHNIPALDQIMAGRRPGDNPLSEPTMVWFLTHTCVPRPHELTHCVRDRIDDQLSSW